MYSSPTISWVALDYTIRLRLPITTWRRTVIGRGNLSDSNQILVDWHQSVNDLCKAKQASGVQKLTNVTDPVPKPALGLKLCGLIRWFGKPSKSTWVTHSSILWIVCNFSNGTSICTGWISVCSLDLHRTNDYRLEVDMIGSSWPGIEYTFRWQRPLVNTRRLAQHPFFLTPARTI